MRIPRSVRSLWEVQPRLISGSPEVSPRQLRKLSARPPARRRGSRRTLHGGASRPASADQAVAEGAPAAQRDSPPAGRVVRRSGRAGARGPERPRRRARSNSALDYIQSVKSSAGHRASSATRSRPTMDAVASLTPESRPVRQCAIRSGNASSSTTTWSCTFAGRCHASATGLSTNCSPLRSR